MADDDIETEDEPVIGDVTTDDPEGHGIVGTVVSGIGQAALWTSPVAWGVKGLHDYKPSFVADAVRPTSSRVFNDVADFASSDSPGSDIMGWGIMATAATIGISLVPALSQPGGLASFGKNMAFMAAGLPIAITLGAGLATWAKRGFEMDELAGSIMDAGIDTVGWIGDLTGMDVSGALVDFIGTEALPDVTGLPADHPINGVRDMSALANFGDVSESGVRALGTVYQGTAGEAFSSPVDGRIVAVQGGEEVEGELSFVVIESSPGVYTVLRGLEGVSEDMVGQRVSEGEEIAGLTMPEGTYARQLLVTYETEIDGETVVRAAPVDPVRYSAEDLVDDHNEALRDAHSRLGATTPDAIFEDHIVPEIHKYGRPTSLATDYDNGAGHVVHYSTADDASLVARADMTVMHVEDGMMIVKYDDDTFGVYRGIDGADEALIGQEFKAGDTIEGAPTGGDYSYTIVAETQSQNDTTIGVVVDPRLYTPQDLMGDASLREEAVAHTEDTLTAKVEQSYFSHIRPLMEGLPLNTMEVFTVDDPEADTPDSSTRSGNTLLMPELVELTDFGQPVSLDAPGTIVHVGDMPGNITGIDRRNALVVDHGEGVYSVRSGLFDIDESVVGQEMDATEALEGFTTGTFLRSETWIRGEDDNLYRVDTLAYPVETLVGDTPEAIASREAAIQNTMDLTDGLVGARRNMIVPARELPAGIEAPEAPGQISAFGLEDGVLSLGVGVATNPGMPLISDVSGKIVEYDLVSDSEAAAQGIDGGPEGEGLFIAHSVEAGVYTQYTSLQEVGNHQYEYGIQNIGEAAPAITDDYTERRLIVVDATDGQPYYVDPEAYDIDRLVTDADYRAEAVQATKDLAAGNPELLEQLKADDYALPEIEAEEPVVNEPAEELDETLIERQQVTRDTVGLAGP